MSYILYSFSILKSEDKPNADKRFNYYKALEAISDMVLSEAAGHGNFIL